jgi:hypothetical protein
MPILICKASVLLFGIDVIVHLGKLRLLYQIIQRAPVRQLRGRGAPPPQRLCRAMDFACVFYFKKVMCLQRSAATTLLLRHYGWHARMVTGAKVLPFKSHAWVEIDGKVTNDRPYVSEIYQVLERC